MSQGKCSQSLKNGVELEAFQEVFLLDKTLPDVALESGSEAFPPLAWVGMREIEVPVWLTAEGQRLRLSARAEARVSLDKKAERGIHMSRLYMATQENLGKDDVSFAVLEKTVGEFLESHQALSSRASLSLKFDLPLSRHALKSDNRAWRQYPVILTTEIAKGQTLNFLEVLVTYSSTCPASAALSRQLIQENFRQTFAEGEIDFARVHEWLGSKQGMIATPHAQRSFARVKVQVSANFSVENLIDIVEEALQTPVQGAVKREDEQEFALRNGQNLMFCEDAARRVKKALDSVPEILDYVAEMNHVESLHPHNAVSVVNKGLRLQDF